MKTPEWVSADEAIRYIQKGKRIFIGSGCGEPRLLVKSLIEHSYLFSDNEVVQLYSMGGSPFLKGNFKDAFRYNTFFVGPGSSTLKGLEDFTPMFLYEIPELFSSGQLPVHCALIQVSPPNVQGEVSLGLSADTTLAAVEKARMVIAQVNHAMPETMGQTKIPVSKIDYFVAGDDLLPELKRSVIDPVTMKIGEQIAGLIKDGDTLQLRKGLIHNAVAEQIKDKNDLGIHSEMISDGVLKLIRNGNITNKLKGQHNGVCITSFVMGSQKMYEYMHSNPPVELYPCDYVCHPTIVANNRNMVSITTALELDLTGQISSDWTAPKLFGGMGGQIGFVRGAQYSKGGRSIIALPSTAKNGTLSRISSNLTEGSGLMVTRNDVEYVVTEFGVAYLKGKTNRERGLALIEVAHPKFRDELLASLKKRNYVSVDQVALKGDPSALKSLFPSVKTFKDNKRVHFRLLYPSDERALQDFFYSLSQESIYNGFKRYESSMHHEQAMKWLNVNYLQEFAIVGFDADVQYSRIVCVAGYVKQPQYGNRINLLIHDQYQGLGLGSFLMESIIKAAKYQCVTPLTATILISNSKMIKIFNKYGFKKVGPVERNWIRYQLPIGRD